MSVTYTTFPRFDAPQPTLVTEPWETLTERLAQFVETESKDDVGLFSPTSFTLGTKRRNKTCASECGMLVLDFDNGKKIKGVKVRVQDDDLITPDFIEAILSDYTYVLVTSHSHDPAKDWPRFRVVLPLAKPIKAGDWVAHAKYAVETFGLLDHPALDNCYTDIARQFYWPSHPPGTEGYYIKNDGKRLDIELPANRQVIGVPKATKAPTEFTADQIATYWETELPDVLVDSPNPAEWHGACPLHSGEKTNFWVNKQTGMWKCFSGCKDLFGEDKAGGDIYRFHELRHDVTFKKAKDLVHDIIGGEPGASMTADELEMVIEISSPDQVDDLLKEIARQPTKARNKLQKQLVTLHQLNPEELRDKISIERKVIQFDRRNEGVAATIAMQQEYQRRVENGEADAYGLILDPTRYAINEDGVHTVQVVRGSDPVRFALASPPIADRPIWPAAMGHDLATNKIWVKLAWRGSNGVLHEEWHPEYITKDRMGLLLLDDAPISLGNLAAISAFLTYAKTTLADEFLPITSLIGWVGPPATQRFVLPEDEECLFIGSNFDSVSDTFDAIGDVDAWAEGLRSVLDWGVDGYVVLAAVGLSAGSPFVRLFQKRNPIIGLIYESSYGKNKTIDYALSIWRTPKPLTVPATSSVKGSQDIGYDKPDIPIFIDELQQLMHLDYRMVEALLYFMGNGQRRVTSSMTKTAVGGEQRYGPYFYASEEEITGALQKGAQNRAIEFHQQPLRDKGMATIVERSTFRNYGVVGRVLALLLNEQRDERIAAIDATVDRLFAQYGNLRGDDLHTVAFIVEGLRMLEDVTNLKLPIDDFTEWLVVYLGGTRSNSHDAAEVTFRRLMEYLMSRNWEVVDNGDRDVLMDQDGIIALRRSTAICPERAPMEIIPTAETISKLLHNLHQNERIAKVWIKQGWLQAQSCNTKWTRSTAATYAPGARVWRVTPAGLAILGLNVDFTPLTPEKESDDDA